MTIVKHETLAQFIEDITPFFFKHRISYVDVGAYKGKVFKEFLISGLAIGEAHLFEPNPTTFSVLKKRVRAGVLPGKGSLSLYNIALGKEKSKVKMQAADTMTRVIEHEITNASDTCANTKIFEVECLTLDELSNYFTDKHISLLKIDAEGYERHILIGASKLMSEQRVDVIYVEAGLNPENMQQCYYRFIDDIMLSHKYRLFRIYEQMYEWKIDSPFLRRMNLAYFSSKFADLHPYRKTHEYFNKASQDNANIKHVCESVKCE